MNTIIIFCASYLYLAVVAGIIFAWFQTDKSLKPQLILTTILAGVMALILSRIAGHLYYDPRPFVTQHVQPLIAHAADNGFPSDHALLTMTLTAATYFFKKKIALGTLALTVIVGASRVLAKVHSPLDIGAGWVIGIIGAMAGYCLARWWYRRYAGPAKDAS